MESDVSARVKWETHDAQNSNLYLYIIVDESKIYDGLGPGFPIPVEITPFCHEHTIQAIAALPSCAGCKPVLRMGSSSNNKVDGDTIAVTDNGNYIVDLHFTKIIKNAPKMARDLKTLCGVVDHGIFSGMTSAVIIAGSDGVVVKSAEKKDKIIFNLAIASAAIGLAAVLGSAISSRRR